jgi:hypothetical protein
MAQDKMKGFNENCNETKCSLKPYASFGVTWVESKTWHPIDLKPILIIYSH